MQTDQLALLIRAVARLGLSADARGEAVIADLARLIAGRTPVAAGLASEAMPARPRTHTALAADLGDPSTDLADLAPARHQPAPDAADAVVGDEAPRPRSEAGLSAWPATLRTVAERADLDTAQAAPRVTAAPAAPASAEAGSSAAPLESLFAARRVRGILREMAVRSSESGRIDLGALVRTLAQGQWPQRLPRQRVTRMGPAVHLLFDAGPDMLPFAADKQQLASVALRILGRDRLRIFDFIGTPLAGVRAQRQVRWSGLAWPPRGSTLVVVSDFGIGSRDSVAHDADWAALRDESRRRGVRSVVLLPYAMARWPAAPGRFDTAFSWDLDAGVQRLRRSRRQAGRA